MMNLESTTEFTPNLTATSASGTNYDWNVSGRKTTVLEHSAAAAQVSKNVLTSKPVIISAAVIAAAVVLITAITVANGFRQRAHQAELQRTSRVVVL